MDERKDDQGYGNYQHPELHKTVKAHRYAYEMVNGPIPEGMIVMHTCDNPRCVRHDHLLIGTDKQNSSDMVNKGRHAGQKKTHCKQGHEFTDSNVYILPTGNRSCKECRRTSVRKMRERNASN